MSFWSKIGRLLTVDDSIMDEEFSLLPPDQSSQSNDDGQQSEREHSQEQQNEERPNQKKASQQQSGSRSDKEQTEDKPRSHRKPGRELKKLKPRKIGTHRNTGAPLQIKRIPYYEISRKDSGENRNGDAADFPETVSDNLRENRSLVERLFRMPINKDVIIRDILVAFETPLKGFIVFMEGISDKQIINEFILEPLMLFASIPPETTRGGFLDSVKDKLLPGNQVLEHEKWDDVKKNILSGSTAIFLEGVKKVLIVETKGWAQRGVGETKTETVVRGPHDAFTENLRSNTGLVRARLRTEKLITEIIPVGELAPTDVAIMYVDGIVNPRLVEEVKRRIKAIKVDFLQDSGQMEQFIEDPPRGFLPKLMATERPDRVASSLSEGFVAVIVGQSPYVLILPTMFWSLLHTAEDAYLRFPFGSFIRLIRFSSFMIALLLPALYIAITNFHPEMIPTDLMLAIAAARERVPFPVVLEVLLMEAALELIREAGIRIPNVIGPTIGIVGALILGQAAVQAGIISPLLVIVVAVTALSAFTLPNYNFSFAIRLMRFLFIFLGAIWGFYGIALGIMVVLTQWSSEKSFGVPMLSPVSPFKPSSPDIILRGQVFHQKVRPKSLRPRDVIRQSKITRPWDPTVHESEAAQKNTSRGGNQND